MKQPGHNCTKVGRIGKPHGYKGALRLDLDAGIALQKPAKDTEPVFLVIHQKPVPFFYTQWQETGDSVIVKFEDVDIEDAVRDLLGLDVLAPNEWVEENDELSPAALIDFAVEDSELGRLGFISNYMETPAQVILIMLLNGREVLIPFVEEIVTDIDPETRTIYTDLPDGLLDIN